MDFYVLPCEAELIPIFVQLFAPDPTPTVANRRHTGATTMTAAMLLLNLTITLTLNKPLNSSASKTNSCQT